MKLINKNQSKIKSSTSEKIVRTSATLMTIVWIFMLFFPIYWLVITSFKDASDAFADPPSFVPTTSDDYEIILDYEEATWQGLGEQERKEEMNVVLWSVFREHATDKVGQLKVYACVDNEIVGSAVLQKSSYTLNRTRIWDSNSKLTAEDIVFRMNAIDELDAVTYNTLSEITDESKQKSNEITKEILRECEQLEAHISGNVEEVFWHNNWTNFLQNYIAAWEYPISQGIEGGLWNACKNSIILAVGVVLGQWIVCGLAGYSLSKLFSKRTSRKIMIVFLASSMIPTTTTIVTTYLALQKIGMAESVWGVMIPMFCSSSNILLFKSNFDGIPTEMLEAARVDGASEMTIFMRMIIPLSKPIFATIGILTFGGAWGEFFWSNIILRDRSQFTVPMVLKILFASGGANMNYPMMMAMSLIISVPTILIMIFGQKHLSKGMVFTGLKG